MIDLAHSIIREQITKFNGGYKSPEEIDLALYRSLLDYYNLLFSPKINAQELTRYLKEQACNISSTNSFSLNTDYKSPANIYSKIGVKKYEGAILEETEWMDRVNSAILPPELESPIARLIGGKIEFYPSDAGNYILSYYRVPVKPVWAYTVAENGRDRIYDTGASVDLDIDSNSLNNVIVGALGYFGISLEKESLLLEKQISGN